MNLSYPTKPYLITQPFGANPEYYSRFKDALGNTIKAHMGTDSSASHGTPLYCPIDGQAQYRVDSHGGDGIYIYTLDSYLVVLWHLCSKDDPVYKPLIAADGSLVPVKRGQLLGYSDNTGAPFESSGDHLHTAVYELNELNQIKNVGNGYGGAINPIPFYDGTYAVDFNTDPFKHNFQKTIVYKESSDEVTALQTALKLQGDFVPDPTGYFGPITRAALMKFQQRNGIQSNGEVCGPQTRAVLNRLYNS